MTPSEIVATHKVHRQILGGGWLRLKPGQVTDDTQMCLALGDAILSAQGWDLPTVANAFVTWMRSRPPDIGNTCRRGIRRYMLDGTLAAPPAEDSAGNGAAMRNLPVALAFAHAPAAFERCSIEQAHVTHNHPFSDAATLTLGHITRILLGGGDKLDCRHCANDLVAKHPQFRFDPWPGRTSGYIVDTTQTVLDAFFGSTSFEECLVNVVNRGGDADTTGALAGQLAGACYGVAGIPERWLKRLDHSVAERIRLQTPGLLALARPARVSTLQPANP
jgi:ADP-ribosyl-[dinitrogen reductase] hydrolase